jgi:membrane-associated protease RseP (regulator of RpoE activity)
MDLIVLFVLGLASIWITINILHRALWHRSERVIVKYGVLLFVKAAGTVKASGIIKKVGFLWVALYALALFLGVYTSIVAAYTRFTQMSPSVVILVPGISVTGVDLVFMIAAICIAAFIHEYLHAKVAVSNSVNVKGYGVILALIAPLAFVDLDEESFSRAPRSSRFKVLAAGVAGNLILYFIVSLMLIGLTQSTGLLVASVASGSLAEEYGIKPYDVILAVNGTEITSINTLRDYMSRQEDTTLVFTVWRFNEGYGNITVFKPANVTLLGVSASVAPRLELATVLSPVTVLYAVIFASWLSIVNFSLAIINALPLYITDGGRIATLLLGERGGKIANIMGLALLVLLLASSRI